MSVQIFKTVFLVKFMAIKENTCWFHFKKEHFILFLRTISAFGALNRIHKSDSDNDTGAQLRAESQTDRLKNVVQL